MTKNICLFLIFYVQFTLGGRPEFPEEFREILEHVHNTCRDQTGTTEQDISNCENGIFKEDNKLKCYMFCLLEEANFADENGTVDYDMLIGMIPEEWKKKVGTMINSCKHNAMHHIQPHEGWCLFHVTGRDKCENAFAVHKCCYKMDPDLYFLF